MSLEGQVALVTGAGAARLGRAIAIGLAERGADVAIHYHQSADGAAEAVAAVRALGRRAEAFAADLTCAARAQALPGEVVAHFGRLDILVQSAANFLRAPLAEVTLEHWQETIDLNLRAPFLLAQAAAPFLRASGRGRIVHVADTAGLRPWPAYLPYCVSKAGLITLTQGLARALAPEVTVNAVAPGPVLPADDMGQADIDRALARIPLQRTGTPADVVRAILYLIAEAPYVTGAVLPVDGGRHVG